LIDSIFKIHNIGVAVTREEWIHHCKNDQPKLVLIGSMNGDLLPVIETIQSLKEVIDPGKILVGGKLNLGSQGKSLAPLLRAHGVNILESDNPSFAEISDICRALIERNRSSTVAI
jgi:hypothetical protein